MAEASIFWWRDGALDGPALEARVREAVSARPAVATQSEKSWLTERWGPLETEAAGVELALHFMERFAPITQRVPRGLAYTAITTMRLERPIGQQEEFNRATLLFCQELLAEVASLRRRVADLEAREARP
jgi:hypothetical protein